MAKKTRRMHAPAFKAQVALAALVWDKTRASGEEVFGGGNAAMGPPVDLKVLHAKIGPLTLENNILEVRSLRRDAERSPQMPKSGKLLR